MKTIYTKESRVITVVTLVIVFLITIVFNLNLRSNTSIAEFEDVESYKTEVPLNLEYKEVVPEPVFKNLNMIGYVKPIGVRGDNSEQRTLGMILRTLRFQNITTKIERKYGLPDKLLLAMVMQESGGADLLPNSSDDGGLGLCHMQPNMSRMFGLKTYQNCNQLRSRTHGLALRRLIQKNSFDRKKLIEYDDRFHPIKNLDAAARMLAYFMEGKQFKETKLQTAIYCYAGRKNYDAYFQNITLFMELLNDSEVIDRVKDEFTALNPDMTINGHSGTFEDYIKVHQLQNRNYGLDNYK